MGAIQGENTVPKSTLDIDVTPNHRMFCCLNAIFLNN